MTMENGRPENLIYTLSERVKELQCLYRVEELTRAENQDIDTLLRQMLSVIPLGWQESGSCIARIVFRGKVFQEETEYNHTNCQKADLKVNGKTEGMIQVCYD